MRSTVAVTMADSDALRHGWVRHFHAVGISLPWAALLASTLVDEQFPREARLLARICLTVAALLTAVAAVHHLWLDPALGRALLQLQWPPLRKALADMGFNEILFTVQGPLLSLASWYWRNLHYAHGEEGRQDCFAAGFDKAEWNRDYWTGLFAHGFVLRDRRGEGAARAGEQQGMDQAATGHGASPFVTRGAMAQGVGQRSAACSPGISWQGYTRMRPATFAWPCLTPWSCGGWMAMLMAWPSRWRLGAARK